MEILDLARALLRHDALAARQWVADAKRRGLDWTTAPAPESNDRDELAVAAAATELLATRAGQAPPAWTSSIGPPAGAIVLVRSAETMPRLRRMCKEQGPAPFRRRGILAPPDFLTIA